MLPDFTRREFDTGATKISVWIGGSGDPLLLLHGYPETHLCWRKVAPILAKEFTLVIPDLRGYGDSGKPASDKTHAPYSKRAMAEDQVSVMRQLGFSSFLVAGHDRGGRVAHRLMLDNPGVVKKWAVLDIAPTLSMYERTDMEFAKAYYHWFFLIQPYDLPERLIGSNAEYYLRKKFKSWTDLSDAIEEETIQEYVRCFRDPDAIHASCEDYRAAVTIDLDHDRADLNKKIQAPLLALWAASGTVERLFNVLDLWRERVVDVTGHTLDCGHFLPEERPDEVAGALLAFFRVN